MTKHPHVGVAAIILRDGLVLMGLRQGSHGALTWSFPGGKLEMGEPIQHCAERELLEETGLSVVNWRELAVTNDVFTDELQHWVTLYMVADWDGGEPQILEPEKQLKWDWFRWDDLPEPLFLPVQNLLKQGFVPR